MAAATTSQDPEVGLAAVATLCAPQACDQGAVRARQAGSERCRTPLQGRCSSPGRPTWLAGRRRRSAMVRSASELLLGVWRTLGRPGPGACSIIGAVAASHRRPARDYQVQPDRFRLGSGWTATSCAMRCRLQCGRGVVSRRDGGFVAACLLPRSVRQHARSASSSGGLGLLILFRQTCSLPLSRGCGHDGAGAVRPCGRRVTAS
jgi:hypothetical protein